jgi:hypothetical protein
MKDTNLLFLIIHRSFMNSFPFLSREKKERPIVYKLDWWAYQEALEVTSFEVTVVKSDLGLFNSVSLIRYTVKGWLYHRSGDFPYIRYVHHSEKLIPWPDEFSEEEEEKMPVHAHIRLTPVVALKNLKKRVTERVPFEFSNEYKINSLRWGPNHFKFSCAGIDQHVHLCQSK